MCLATLIENLPALIEKSPKILNLKLKKTKSMNSKETFSRDVTHIAFECFNSCPRRLKCKTYEITCNLLEPRQL